jgi:hypothetical protein
VVFPVITGIGLPFVLNQVVAKRGTSALKDIMNAFAFFFATGASIIPTTPASYSLD